MMWENTEDNSPLVRNRRGLCDYVRLRLPVKEVEKKAIRIPCGGCLTSVKVKNDVCILRFEVKEEITLYSVRNWKDLCDYVRVRIRGVKIVEEKLWILSGARLILLSEEYPYVILRFEKEVITESDET